MKIIIFLLIFAYILSSLTEKYYTSCILNSENIINPSSARCKSFSSKEGYCSIYIRMIIGKIPEQAEMRSEMAVKIKLKQILKK